MRRFQPYVLIAWMSSLFWGCEQGIQRTENTLDYIPENSEQVVKIASLETTQNDLKSTQLFSQLNKAGLYDIFKADDAFFFPNQHIRRECTLFSEKFGQYSQYRFYRPCQQYFSGTGFYGYLGFRKKQL